LVQVSKTEFKEMVEMNLIDLNVKDKMHTITNRRNSKSKTYYVVDTLLYKYKKLKG
jgi:hypothetical protein